MNKPLIPEHVEPVEPWPRPDHREVKYVDVGKMSPEEAQRELDKVSGEAGFVRIVYRVPFVAKVVVGFAIASWIFLAVVYLSN